MLYTGVRFSADGQGALVGGHWNGEAGDGLIRSVVFYVNSVGNIFNSLWLILN